MARQSVIDKKGLGPRVLTMAAGGVSHREIAKALAKEGVKLSHVAVMNYLAGNVEERKQATEQVKAAVQAELQKHALSDVELLQELRDMTMQTLRTATVDDRLSKEWAALVGQARAVIESRIKIAGAGGDDKPEVHNYHTIIREEAQKALNGAPKTVEAVNQQFPLPPPPGTHG